MRLIAADSEQAYLGEYPSCVAAVAKAKTIYPASDGCAHCCPDCHKG